jgi:hypothetical protein
MANPHLNLDDNKRPYFKQLNLDATFDEIQAYVNTLTDATLILEFLLFNAGGDYTTLTKLTTDIDGKHAYEMVSESQTPKVFYSSIDLRWYYSLNDVNVAYIDSVSNYPQSGTWTIITGGTVIVTTKVLLFDSVQKFVEDQTQMNIYLTNQLPTETQITVDFQQLLDLPDTSIELLPDLPLGKAYIIERIQLRYYYNSTTFTGGSNFNIAINGTSDIIASVPVTLVNSVNDKFWANQSFNQNVVYSPNKGIQLQMSSYLADGDGTVDIRIFTKTIEV